MKLETFSINFTWTYFLLFATNLWICRKNYSLNRVVSLFQSIWAKFLFQRSDFPFSYPWMLGLTHNSELLFRRALCLSDLFRWWINGLLRVAFKLMHFHLVLELANDNSKTQTSAIEFLLVDSIMLDNVYFLLEFPWNLSVFEFLNFMYRRQSRRKFSILNLSNFFYLSQASENQFWRQKWIVSTFVQLLQLILCLAIASLLSRIRPKDPVIATQSWRFWISRPNVFDFLVTALSFLRDIWVDQL